MNLILRPQTTAGAAFLQHYRYAFSNVQSWDRNDPHRVLSLRCSGLPFCSLDFFVNLAYNGMSRSLDFSGLFYTSVGTAVHTVMQRALALEGGRLWGNWLCKKCGNFERYSIQRTCCETPMQYEEIDIDYKGIKGHVDTLFAMDVEAAQRVSALKSEKKRLKAMKKLKFAIVDYKTTSMAARDKKSKSPGWNYIEQIMAYAYLLGKQYELKIKTVMLCFIPRDNPKDPALFIKNMDAEDFKVIGRKLKSYKRAHKQVLSASSWSDVKELIEDYGMCNDAYCKVCKSANPRGILKAAYKKAKEMKRLPLRPYVERFL